MTGNVWEWVHLNNSDGGVLRGGGSILSAGLGRCRSRHFTQKKEPLQKMWVPVVVEIWFRIDVLQDVFELSRRHC